MMNEKPKLLGVEEYLKIMEKSSCGEQKIYHMQYQKFNLKKVNMKV